MWLVQRVSVFTSRERENPAESYGQVTINLSKLPEKKTNYYFVQWHMD
jgi:hypothetical protein